MKSLELRQKTENELKQILEDRQKALADLKFALASGKVKNIKEVRQARRDIARILTVLQEFRSVR
jgi:large subunit ribosomal protein L29